jgi:predicted GNAT superfamily acetyltransferase
MSGDGVMLRELSGRAELLRAEAFQIEVWGAQERPDNADILMALQSEGALVAGAFKDDRMLGFLFAFPTKTPSLQHSHRLAVHSHARGLGLGTRLKWFQRDWCLARSITTVRWTYDPLRAINAGLNIGVLGAVAHEYLIDYYGPMPGINAGLPSDRVMAVWHLEQARHIQTQMAPETTRLTIPPNFDALMQGDRAFALAERLRVRDALQASFAKGRGIIGYDRARHSYFLG